MESTLSIPSGLENRALAASHMILDETASPMEWLPGEDLR